MKEALHFVTTNEMEIIQVFTIKNESEFATEVNFKFRNNYLSVYCKHSRDKVKYY